MLKKSIAVLCKLVQVGFKWCTMYGHKRLVSIKLVSSREWHCNSYVKLVKLYDSDNKSVPDI